MKRHSLHIVLCLILFMPLSLKAQQFTIESFKTIPNDLTAFHSPVYDLNHDACALVKIVCSSDYVFDSPLGIVKRTDEVGEVWLYLPKGSMLLTIRHSQWGVLRDYQFAEELASNITYELVINSPQPIVQAITSKEQPIDIEPDGINIEEEKPVFEEPDTQPSANISTSYIIAGIVGFSNETISYGVRLAILRKHGFWLSILSDFKTTPTTAGDCDQKGKLINGSGTPYYNGEIKRSLVKIKGGGIHRIIGGLHIYEGIGYGDYSVVWCTTNGINYKNKDDSAIGLSAEVGALYRIGSVVLSIGGSTIMAKHWEANAGIGICF